MENRPRAVEVGCGILMAIAGVLAVIGGSVDSSSPHQARVLWTAAGIALLLGILIFLGYFVFHPFALYLDRKRIEWTTSAKVSRDAARTTAAQSYPSHPLIRRRSQSLVRPAPDSS